MSIGTAIDNFYSSFVHTLQACAGGPTSFAASDTTPYTVYGNSDYTNTAAGCYIVLYDTNYYDCYCVNTNYATNSSKPGTTYSLAAANSSDVNGCYGFNGGNIQSNCGVILVLFKSYYLTVPVITF